MGFRKWKIALVVPMFLLVGATPLFGTEIRIQNGKNLIVTGKTLFANCADIIIEGGAALVLNSALLQDMGLRSGSGELTLNNSNVVKCYDDSKSFFVIPKPDGTATIICL